MPDDQQLLDRFIEHRSEAAFRELVERYVNLVYSTALRRMHTREDIPVLLGEPERIVKERLAKGQPT